MSKTTLFFTLLCLLFIVGCTVIVDSPNSTDTLVKTESPLPTVAWTYSMTGGQLGSTCMGDGVAYFDMRDDATQSIQAYDLQTRQLQWSTPLSTDVPLLLGSEELFLLNRNQGTLSAISRKDGSTIWQVSLPTQGYEYEMVFGDGVLFFGVGDVLSAIDAAGGQILWQRSLPSSYRINSAWLGQTYAYREYGALSYYNGGLFIRLWGSTEEQQKKCLLLAVDALDGQEKWRTEFEIPILEESPPPMVASQPAFESQSVFFIDWEGRAYLIEASTGKMIWEVDAEFPVARPLRQSEKTYVPIKNGLLCLDSNSGEELWSITFPKSHIVSPIRAFENAVAFITRHLSESETELFLIDNTTGDLISRSKMPAVEGCMDCVNALEIDSGKLYVVQSNTLVAVDLRLSNE